MNNQEARELKKSEISTSTFTTYGGYTKAYVKDMENELSKLLSENLYLKSNEYLKKILSSKDEYLKKIFAANQQNNAQELESKIDSLTKENEKLHQEKESMNQKINLLSQLVYKLSQESIERENILTNLKEILDK